jgi:GNAT superfamily N-acetyltransferase
MITIEKIELPVAGMEQLRAEARSEGYDFLDTLVEDWESAENRFDALGEILCGHFDRGQLAAVGGLNCDPFAGQPDMGRIRRVYVRHDCRNKGIGRELVSFLVNYARSTFRSVRLRAENAHAAHLYESLGFVPIENPDATHILLF